MCNDIGATIIIPANNEESYIQNCLKSLIDQDYDGALKVIISANACTDRTVESAKKFEEPFGERGWSLQVLESSEPGKLAALNRAEANLKAGTRIYLDADVICSPRLIARVIDVLSVQHPRYACGRLVLAPARTLATRAYGRVWSQLPYVKRGRTGAGFFCVNSLGRERWGEFPDIIADDHFVRLNFAPEERISVDETYEWPLVEGMNNLIKVRRRQDAGNRQIEDRFPELKKNEDDFRVTKAYTDLILEKPISFSIFALIVFLARLPVRERRSWSRGR